MDIVFLAPVSVRRRALAIETARAADAGHRVGLVAERRPEWAHEELDARVEVRWVGANGVEARESALTHLVCRRLPLGLLRRIGRGPLRPWAKRASRRWRRKVVGPLDKRLQRRTRELRRDLRIERSRAAVRDWNPDWLVLHEPSAVEACIGFLPGLLETRPALRTTYNFEAAEPHRPTEPA